MSYTITRSSLPAVSVPQRQHTWPLQVVVTGSHGDYGPKVFVYHAAMGDDPYKGDRCECVASVSQMLETPEDAATASDADGRIIPFYRLASGLFLCHSAVEAEELWAKVQEDIADLVENLSSAGLLASSEVVVLP